MANCLTRRSLLTCLSNQVDWGRGWTALLNWEQGYQWSLKPSTALWTPTKTTIQFKCLAQVWLQWVNTWSLALLSLSFSIRLMTNNLRFHKLLGDTITYEKASFKCRHCIKKVKCFRFHMQPELYFAPVIRATFFFNLSCNIVALQVETLCCAYYHVSDQLVSQQNTVLQVYGILQV